MRLVSMGSSRPVILSERYASSLSEIICLLDM